MNEVKIKRNVFVAKPRPNKEVSALSVIDLCYVHDQQVLTNGDGEYINLIQRLIKSKSRGYAPGFSGEGCCSEFRNSVEAQAERFKEIMSQSN